MNRSCLDFSFLVLNGAPAKPRESLATRYCASTICRYVKPLSGIQTPPIAGRAGFRRAQESRRSSRKPRFLPDHPSGHASALGPIQWKKPSILQEEQHVNDNVNFYAGGARGAVTLREHHPTSRRVYTHRSDLKLFFSASNERAERWHFTCNGGPRILAA